MSKTIAGLISDIYGLKIPKELQEHSDRLRAWIGFFGDANDLDVQLKEAGHLRKAVCSLLINLYDKFNDCE